MMESFKDKQLGPLLWQFFAFTFAFSTFFSGFALFAERRFMHDGLPFGTKEVGYVFAFSGLIGVLIQGGGMGHLVKAFGESRLVQMGFAAMTAGFALLAAVHAIPYLLLAIALLTFGSAILRPSLTALITTPTRATVAGDGHRTDAVVDVGVTNCVRRSLPASDTDPIPQHMGIRRIALLRHRLDAHRGPEVTRIRCCKEAQDSHTAIRRRKHHRCRKACRPADNGYRHGKIEYSLRQPARLSKQQKTSGKTFYRASAGSRGIGSSRFCQNA